MPNRKHKDVMRWLEELRAKDLEPWAAALPGREAGREARPDPCTCGFGPTPSRVPPKGFKRPEREKSREKSNE
jgi:hypothetical protein